MVERSVDGAVSVVVPVRNRECIIEHCLRHLEQACLRAIRQTTGIEIVLVDDASEDASARLATDYPLAPPIRRHVVRLERRRGPAIARNAGVLAAAGDLVVFVDSDVLVVPEFIEAHLEAHRSAGRKALVVGPVRTVASVEEAARRPPGRIWDISTNPLDTANASVRKEHLMTVGLFDTGFDGFGWEDIDLGWRLLRLGLRRLRAPRAIAYHIKPPVRDSTHLERLLATERERARMARHLLSKYPGLAGRMTVQYSSLHLVLNWMMRMGGLIRKDNVTAWMQRAERLGLGGLSRIWLSGILTQEYLGALRAELSASGAKS